MSDLEQTMRSALTKPKEAMDGGPFGPDATPTATESCLVHRALDERLGMKAPD